MSTAESPSLAEWLQDEPYTLVCSSGFFGFYAQSGMISALSESDLLPQATRGSSTGALATALWAAEGFDYEKVSEVLAGIQRADFWDPGIGLGLLKGDRLDESLREMLANKTIEECRVPVHISVFDLGSRQAEVIDSGDLTQAVHASIAIPPLFQPVKIGGGLKLDGGIKDHAGCHGAPKDERILHQNYRAYNHDITEKGFTNSQRLRLVDLPFVHPFSARGLSKGIEAFHQARSQTLVNLDQPIK